MNQVEKPKHRSKLRQSVGKEYYILKRKWQWFWDKNQWATAVDNTYLPHEVFTHQSLILRPLKDVEMYLQENKRTNLALAIAHLDKVLIQPGQTFSFWKLVGRPTQNKGYLDGLVLQQGKIAVDVGGGLCQLGNLLFWLFAHSPLTITERYRHGYDVFPDVNRKVPFGAGATLSYNYIDLQVKNNTPYSFQLQLWLNDTHLCGKLLSNQKIVEKYTVEERNHLIQRQMWGGYSRHNQIVQIVKYPTTTQEKLLVENHAIMMYNPFIESKK